MSPVSRTDWDNLRPDGTRYRQRKEANELLGKRSSRNSASVSVDLAGRKMSAVAPVQVHLSPRLEQVVTLVLQGKNNTEIARELGLSEGTIKVNMNRIFKKLKVHNRTAVAVWAFERNR